jgi:hypothetical protein
MARALFLVINSLDRWWVDFEGQATGPFDTIQQAALEAQHMARRLSESMARITEVLAPDGSGKYWVVWSSEREHSRRYQTVPGEAAE